MQTNDSQSSNGNSSVSEWELSGGNIVDGNNQNSTNSSLLSSSTTWGTSPLSSGPGSSGSTMNDITNKQPSSSSSLSSVNNSTSTGASSSVWQSNEPGDNSKNSWNSAANMATAGSISHTLLSPKNTGSIVPSFGTPGNSSGQGQDKENIPSTSLPLIAERTPLDNMIYRDGWGQVEVKQETPWAVPESPPPVNDDPSVWKPKANTGTEVWEKNTGHRTQPWQNQGPNTPRWMSEEHETSSVWPGAPASAQMSASLSSGPRSAGIINMAGGVLGGNGNGGGDGILSNGGLNGPVSQAGRSTWNASGAGSGGSGGSSGGNISPTNQWSEDTNWSDWRDPNARKTETDDGTGHWGGGHGSQPAPRPSNGLYAGGNSMGLGENRKLPSDAGFQQKPRGWNESGYGNSSSQPQQRGSSSDWNEDGGDWRGVENEKSSQWSAGNRDRSHQQQRAFSPPNGVTPFRNTPKFTREQIYNTKQYQGLLEMGFKRDEIDIAMRNSNMNYEATLADLQQQRRRQQLQQQIPSSNSSNFGIVGSGDNSGFGKTGLPGTAGLGGGGGGGSLSANMQHQVQQQQHQNNTLMQQQQQQQPQSNKTNQSRPVPNIQAMAQQLSIAARQGIINPRLLSQPLAPQTVYFLHKLMQMHRQLQQSSAQHDMLSNQKNMNPTIQQQQMSQIVLHVQQTKKDITVLQKQIDAMQNEFLKSPMDPRFQGGPTLVDLAASMAPSGFLDFHSPPAVPPVAAAASNYTAGGWRMPEPNPYSAMGGGDAWAGIIGGNTFGAANNNLGAFNTPAGMAPMWNDPNNWMGSGQSGMGYRPFGPGTHPGGSGGMEDWASMHGGHMKMSGMGMHGQSGLGDRGSMSPARGGTSSISGNGNSGYGSRQMDPNSFSSFSRFAGTWDTLPEFEPGKPWRGAQVLSSDDDPHLTPGSVAKSPLMNAVTSVGGGHYASNE